MFNVCSVFKREFLEGRDGDHGRYDIGALFYMVMKIAYDQNKHSSRKRLTEVIGGTMAFFLRTSFIIISITIFSEVAGAQPQSESLVGMETELLKDQLADFRVLEFPEREYTIPHKYSGPEDFELDIEAPEDVEAIGVRKLVSDPTIMQVVDLQMGAQIVAALSENPEALKNTIQLKSSTRHRDCDDAVKLFKHMEIADRFSHSDLKKDSLSMEELSTINAVINSCMVPVFGTSGEWHINFIKQRSAILKINPIFDGVDKSFEGVEEGKYTYCSAFIINDQEVVTARHCLFVKQSGQANAVLLDKIRLIALNESSQINYYELAPHNSYSEQGRFGWQTAFPTTTVSDDYVVLKLARQIDSLQNVRTEIAESLQQTSGAALLVRVGDNLKLAGTLFGVPAWPARDGTASSQCFASIDDPDKLESIPFSNLSAQAHHVSTPIN